MRIGRRGFTLSAAPLPSPTSPSNARPFAPPTTSRSTPADAGSKTRTSGARRHRTALSDCRRASVCRRTIRWTFCSRTASGAAHGQCTARRRLPCNCTYATSPAACSRTKSSTLKVRDILRINGPHGSFTLREESENPWSWLLAVPALHRSRAWWNMPSTKLASARWSSIGAKPKTDHQDDLPPLGGQHRNFMLRYFRKRPEDGWNGRSLSTRRSWRLPGPLRPRSAAAPGQRTRNSVGVAGLRTFGRAT